MLAVASSGALKGIRAVPVQVEVNTYERGEPRIILVGLPDTAVRESNDRVVSALGNTGLRVPHTRTTINLAPGSLRKEGPIYDLPIALGYLAASDQLDAPQLADYLICGELSLSGETRPIKGGLSLAMLARDQKKRGILLPPISADEAALVEGVSVYQVQSLDQAVRFLEGALPLAPVQSHRARQLSSGRSLYEVDFHEIKGQHSVRRAVEVAVAGRHNLLMIGPPGSGKSMMAKRIPTIMPDPSIEEFIEILMIHSAAGMTLSRERNFLQRPFRAPHHTISDVGLLGGGTIPGPGEISLAHNGVLFLDELPEFKRSALEVMRQPMEDGQVSISRSAGKVTLPCAFVLIAAMNPCPCGYLGDSGRDCRCSPTQVQRYRNRISGPLLDRIDIHIEASALAVEELRQKTPSENSERIRERIGEAENVQRTRFGRGRTTCNARMSHSEIRKYCDLSSSLGDLLQQAMEQLKLSARAYDRILKVSRTIADLSGSDTIEEPHLLETIQYRSLDRNIFY